MRFTTKEVEFETLKADALEKLANYMEAVKNASYADLNDQVRSLPLVKTYSAFVDSNTAFRTFLNKNRLTNILRDDID